MIYITKQKGLYQNKENSNLVSTCNCKAIGVFFFLQKIARATNFRKPEVPKLSNT